MERKEIIKNWYWNDNLEFRKSLAWQILRDTRRHETSFISLSKKVPQRFYKIGSFPFLLGQLKERFCNIEDKTPFWHYFRSLQLVKFVEEGKPVNLAKDWDSYGFDWYLDIDCGEKKYPDLNYKERVERAYTETEAIVNELDKLKVPFIPTFTGGKGFHVGIPWQYTFDRENKKNILADFFEADDYATIPRAMGFFLVDRVGTTMYDTTIWDKKMGLIRCKYSLHPESLKVCFPLTRQEFKEFSIDLVEPYYIIENVEIRDRQKKVLWNPNGNFKKFYNEFKKVSKISEYKKQQIKEKAKREAKKENILKQMSTLTDKEKKEILKRI